MGTWIDFKELREKLDFETLFRRYNVEIKRKGDQHMGYCPLPHHNGKKNSVSFSANLKKGIFQCFGCGAKGNVLEFAALMGGVDPKDGKALQQVALELQKQFRPQTAKATETSLKMQKNHQTKPREDNLPAVINAPLDFELKGLNPDHPYLGDRGFSKETIHRFGLGVCSRGLFKDRVAIPLRDQSGMLIGYAGRLIDDCAIHEENPKYKFPPARERDGNRLEFRKSLFVYNGYRIEKPADDLIVVEGFASVWWLAQSGRDNAVSTMGASCSEQQAKEIASLVHPRGSVWLISDGDTAGERWAKETLALVAQSRFCRWVRLPEKTQPTDMSPEELKTCFI
jgi:DNA primase